MDKKDAYGFTALHYAAHYGNEGCVRILLDAKTNPNVKDIFDRTPLHHGKVFIFIDGRKNITPIL